ncbi:hypothetical protein MalM25_12590 [Planctomycetes bacterium MalM25]|nr:hypothetical protein MalM25_12590 [Planctomycetes bacterium MalM25]
MPEIMNNPVPVLLVTNAMTLACAAAWFVWPALKKLPARDAMTLLLLPHTARFVGLLFLYEGATQNALPPEFAVAAAGGDVVAALLAWLAVIAVRRSWASGYSVAGVAHAFGLADLTYAVSLGTLHDAPADMGATVWIPALIVPLLLVAHAMGLSLLFACKRRRRQAGEKTRAMAAA